MSGRNGHRGYIGARPLFGSRTPQHVQNLVIRDYCQQRGFRFLLSLTEYRMAGCYQMLEQAVDEAPSLDGIVLYSLFMLPEAAAARHSVYRRVLEAGATLHGAVEAFEIGCERDVARFEDLWLVKTFLHRS